MRELTSLELQAVSGGAMAIARRPEPLFVRILVRVLERISVRLEGGRGMQPYAPKRPAAPISPQVA
jgi:hypothetical protein